MRNMEYLKDMPIAVLGGGAAGKTCAADMKLAGKEVRLYDAMPFAAASLKDVDKTGILLDGVQRNKYCFERSGRAFFDLVTTDMEAAVKGCGQIVVAMGSWGHEGTFKALIPHLEDGMVVHVFADNFGALLLRKMMREAGFLVDWKKPDAPDGHREDIEIRALESEAEEARQYLLEHGFSSTRSGLWSGAYGAY